MKSDTDLKGNLKFVLKGKKNFTLVKDAIGIDCSEGN
jgi:hypothetical protein